MLPPARAQSAGTASMTSPNADTCKTGQTRDARQLPGRISIHRMLISPKLAGGTGV
jgi:hypothetical protein